MKHFLSWAIPSALIGILSISASADYDLQKIESNVNKSQKVTVNASPNPISERDSQQNCFFPRTKKSDANPFAYPKTANFWPKTKSLIKSASSQLPDLRGAVLDGDSWTVRNTGLYSVSTATPEMILPGLEGNAGAVVMDGKYIETDYLEFPGLTFVYITAYDATDGERLYGFQGSVDNIGIDLAIDPTTKDVYGITLTADGKGHQLSKLTYSTVSVETEKIANLEGNWSSFAIDRKGNFYGIKRKGTNTNDGFIVNSSILCKIDRNTGKVTELGYTGMLPQYESSATIDPKTNTMYWAVSSLDGSSSLCTVNLENGLATPLFNYADSEMIMNLYIPEALAEDEAPAEVTDISFDFPGGLLTGNVKAKTPEKLYNGSNASGSLTLFVEVDGNVVALQECGYGEEVSVPVTFTKAGAYNFTIYASNEAGTGVKSVHKHVWVGCDTPMAPKPILEYKDGKMTVSWDAVTTTVNGGYLDTENLYYNVYRGASIVGRKVTGTSWSEDVAEPEDVTSYIYKVYAVVNGKQGVLSSTAGLTNELVLGAMPLPYASDFGATGFTGYTILNANNDTYTWNLEDGVAYVPYSRSKNMDDWLITPPVKLEKGKAYKVGFKTWAKNPLYPEKIEVKWGMGNDVKSMVNTLLPAYTLDHILADNPLDFTGFILPEESGTYYIGFHGISDVYMDHLYLNDIYIEEGLAAKAPKAVTNLKATPDASHALKCTVSFTAPTQSIGDDDLDEISKIEIKRNGSLIKTFEAVTTGAELSFEDTPKTAGAVSYTVIAYNTAGKGDVSETATWVGMNYPADVQNVKVVRTDAEGEVKVTWDVVTADAGGLALSAEEVKYSVLMYQNGSWQPVARNLADNTYTFKAIPAGQQNFVQVAVAAATSAGTGMATPSNMIPAGTPYNGFTESFPNAAMTHIFGADLSGEGKWSTFHDDYFSDMASVDNDGGYIGMYSDHGGHSAILYTGLVSLKGMDNPEFSFYAFNLTGNSKDENIVKIDVEDTATGVRKNILNNTVDEICNNEPGWNRVSASLKAYAGKTVQIYITAECVNYKFTIFDRLCVEQGYKRNLKPISIAAPEEVKCGEDFNVSVGIANYGSKGVNAYTVELYADGNKIAETKEASLTAGFMKDVKFNLTMSPVAEKAVKYHVYIDCADDENLADNTGNEISVQPVMSTLPAPVNLEGEELDNGVALTWTAPDLDKSETKAVTEDFESGESFSNKFPGWTFVDADGSPVGGIQEVDIPCINPEVTKGSFWVWDRAVAGANKAVLAAHSGNKYLFSMYRVDGGAADDWAISPLLNESSQTITFYARSASKGAPDIMKIYYSKKGTDISDFEEIPGVDNTAPVPAGWTCYNVRLPKGAKYFAIRSCSDSGFMLMIDDVKYIPGKEVSEDELIGYEVYRNGELMTPTPIKTCKFLDLKVEEDKVYNYVVVAQYTRGASAKSNKVTMHFKNSGIDGVKTISGVKALRGAIEIQGANGMPVTIVAADGRVIYTNIVEDSARIAADAGAYIVTIGKRNFKVIVL